MEQNGRKATDVLLDIEGKVNNLLELVRVQDFDIKILSNKLNDVLTALNKQVSAPQKITVEAVQNMSPALAQAQVKDPERNIPISASGALPQTDAPDGFRRTSRPETFAPKTLPPMQQSQPPAQLGDDVKMPVQSPQMPNRQGTPPPGRGSGSEVPTANQAPAVNSKGRGGAVMAPPQPQGSPDVPQGQIPVSQRCVDKNGKGIFLADVEIVDIATSQSVPKTRTNATGKWFAAMAVGNYRITIRKRESVTKEKMEAVQDIQIDGTQSRVELPMLIIK